MRISTAFDDLRRALWGVRLRTRPDDNGKMIGCWCYHIDTDEQHMSWLADTWKHDHRCRAARKEME